MHKREAPLDIEIVPCHFLPRTLISPPSLGHDRGYSDVGSFYSARCIRPRCIHVFGVRDARGGLGGDPGPRVLLVLLVLRKQLLLLVFSYMLIL